MRPKPKESALCPQSSTTSSLEKENDTVSHSPVNELSTDDDGTNEMKQSDKSNKVSIWLQ